VNTRLEAPLCQPCKEADRRMDVSARLRVRPTRLNAAARRGAAGLTAQLYADAQRGRRR
jgi:hypothetical protein